MLGISVENLNVVYWEAGNVPATDAGRLRGCPLRKRRCILHCAGLGAECMTNFRPVSWAATSPQPPEYIVKSALQILERANSGHAPQKTSQRGWKCDVTGQVALKRDERLRYFETSISFLSLSMLIWKTFMPKQTHETCREQEGSHTCISETTKFMLCFPEVFQQIMTEIVATEVFEVELSRLCKKHTLKLRRPLSRKKLFQHWGVW